MQPVRRFEELLFWQRARQLARTIYDFTNQAAFRRDRDLRSQLRRAAVSVMSNIAEGFGRGSNQEFLYFLYVAKGSVAEIESQLYLAKDLQYCNEREFQRAFDLCEEVARLTQAFARSMKAAGKQAFRQKRRRVAWREQVEQLMQELQMESRGKD